MPEVVLHSFIIDVVQPVEIPVEQEYEGGPWRLETKVQMVSYKVLAKDGEQAIKRFFEEEAGIEVYRGDTVDRILVGITVDSAGILTVPGTSVAKE